MERLANIYSKRILPGPQTGKAERSSSVPDAKHLAHCCACWRRFLDEGEICEICWVALGFGEEQVRKFEDAAVCESLFRMFNTILRC